MTKKELIAAVAANGNLAKKDAAIAVDAVVSSIMGAIENGDKVQLVGFGTFSTVEQEERERHNPRTGEKITVPAHKVPKFKFSNSFKKTIAG